MSWGGSHRGVLAVLSPACDPLTFGSFEWPMGVESAFLVLNGNAGKPSLIHVARVPLQSHSTPTPPDKIRSTIPTQDSPHNPDPQDSLHNPDPRYSPHNPDLQDSLHNPDARFSPQSRPAVFSPQLHLPAGVRRSRNGTVACVGFGRVKQSGDHCSRGSVALSRAWPREAKLSFPRLCGHRT
jgi:hypothetical protein